MADKFQLKAIISAVDKITPTLKGVARSVKIVHKGLADIGRAGGQLMSKLGLPAALGFAAVAYGAANATRAALDYASGIQDAAERTGASTDAYQVLTNMLGAVGGTAEDAEMAFTKFNKGIADAADGADKSFAGLMKQLKIPLEDAKGNLQSLTDVLPQLADAFAAQTNPATRTRMAMEFFGKSGTKMIPIMLKGGDSVRAMAKEMERLGVVLDGGAVGALDDMGDSLGFVGKQIRTQWTSALASVVPVLLPMINQLTEWIAANKEIIKTEIVSVLTEIATAIRDVNWVEVIRGIRETIVAIKGFIDAVGGMKNVLIGLGIAWLAVPVAAIFSIGAALARMVIGLSSIALANPAILGVVAVVGLLAGAAFLVYKNWDTLKSWFGGFADWITGKFTQIARLAQMLVPDWMRGLLGGGSQSLNIGQAAGAGAGAGAVQGRSPLAAALGGRQNLTGAIDVRFQNAPPGMRVDQGKTNQPGLSLNPDVGYRTLGTSL